MQKLVSEIFVIVTEEKVQMAAETHVRHMHVDEAMSTMPHFGTEGPILSPWLTDY